MIGIYIDCLRNMTEFCERRGFEHEDFPAFEQIVKTYNEVEKPVITITKVKKIVARHFNLISHQLDLDTRLKIIRFPRQLSQYYAYLLTGEGLVEIGTRTGGRTHATILNSLKKIRNLRETKYPYRDYLKLRELDAIFAPYIEKKKERDEKK